MLFPKVGRSYTPFRRLRDQWITNLSFWMTAALCPVTSQTSLISPTFSNEITKTPRCWNCLCFLTTQFRRGHHFLNPSSKSSSTNPLSTKCPSWRSLVQRLPRFHGVFSWLQQAERARFDSRGIRASFWLLCTGSLNDWMLRAGASKTRADVLAWLVQVYLSVLFFGYWLGFPPRYFIHVANMEILLCARCWGYNHNNIPLVTATKTLRGPGRQWSHRMAPVMRQEIAGCCGNE